MARSLRKAEDILPKVLVAGKPSDCVPRIIICDGMQRKSKRSHHGNGSMQFRIPCAGPSHPRSCSPAPSCSPPPTPCYRPPSPPCYRPPSPPCYKPPPPCRKPSPPSTCCPPPKCPPPICPPPIKPRRKSSECCPPAPPSQTQCILEETSACEQLMHRMQNLKEEMYVMARQNERMQQQLRNNHSVQRCRINQSSPCARPVTYPKDVEVRFRDYSKHNNLLEKQVEAMEQTVRRLNQQFLEAEKKQREMEQARIHAMKMTQTLLCQAKERHPKLRCSGSCKGKCSQQFERCTCSKPDYKCG